MHTPLDYDAAIVELDRLVTAGGENVRKTVIGSSLDGRPLVMLDILESNVDETDVQRAVLTAGHHGMEPGGVRGCLKVLSWLIEGNGRSLLDCLHLRCIPMVNPDGLVIDNARNAHGANLDMNYQDEDGLTEPESKAVWKAVSEFQPDAEIDMHNYAATHSSVYIHPRGETPEDEEIAGRIVKRMYDRCAKHDFPMWEPAWLENYPANVISLCHRCYQEFHAFPIVTETNEAQFEPEEEAECGFLMASTVLDLAAETWPGHLDSGFPVQSVKSGYTTSLYARGKTAAERRANRIELWQHRDYLEVRDIWPETANRYRVVLEAVKGYWTPRQGAGLRLRFPNGRTVRAVERDGIELEESPLDGYQVRTDSCSTYLYIDMSYLYGCTDVIVYLQEA
ncbi:MAG TPA: M14 family zinc carboxypeptidase [bacterium]|nr:M14 family zinc carboxypeptidase [bacterium]